MSLLLLRRLLAPPRPSPSSCQLRHASKKASKNSSNVTVQLLQDIPRFGRAGSVISVPRGRMRSNLYPYKLAAYLPRTALKAATAVPRDTSFIPTRASDEAALTSRRAARRLTGLGLTPARATELLEQHLPAQIEFSRATTSSDPEETVIHGSITNADVTAAVMGIMQEVEGDRDARRVVVEKEAVGFVDGGDKVGADGRVKEIGSYRVEIRLKDALGLVRREVKVNRAAAFLL